MLIVKNKAGVFAFCLSLCWCAFLSLTSCTDKNPAQSISQNPQIVLVQAPSSAYQFPATPIGIHVRADDPQGVNTRTGVDLTVRKVNATALTRFVMRDDGQNGDILPNDSQYFWPVDTALVHNQTGDFVLEMTARDQSGLQSETKTNTLTILPGRENRPPQLLSNSIEVPVRVVPDSAYSQKLTARASDPDGPNTVRFVRLEIYPPYFQQPSLIDTLFDDGRHDDGAANDGLFGQTLVPARLSGRCGLHNFVFRAIDVAGSMSLAENKVVTVELTKASNVPPRVSDLNAPTTISRSATPNTYTLSIRATDANGPCDGLARVFFNTFLPNGNPSSGNPFLMRDDGRQGDAVAGDGRYSLTIEITPQNATGNYRFEFQAEDKKGAPSNKITQTITVTN
jgi:hypothetical protein